MQADSDAQLKALEEAMMKELFKMKEDFEHRLALQLAENRRLQSQLSVQKSETAALLQRTGDLEQRVAELEAEIGE